MFEYNNPEPVPTSTQLSVMPFLAAAQGFLESDGPVKDLRLTMHRAMNRDGAGYLQQISGYFPFAQPSEWSNGRGRLFKVTDGIIGKSYETGAIYRTQKFDDEGALTKALVEARKDVAEEVQSGEVASSFLSIPFLGNKSETVLVFYADCKQLNFFADDERIEKLIAMGQGLCNLIDALEETPFPNLRNFGMEPGKPVTGAPTVYEIQEPFTKTAPPQFKNLNSYNFESVTV